MNRKRTPDFLKVFSISLLAGACLLGSASAGAALSVEAFTDAATVSVRKPFSYHVRISWKGSADAYTVAQPTLEPPEALRITASSFSSTALADRRELLYTFELVAEKPGSYTIPPASIAYWAAGSQTQSTLISNETVLRAAWFGLGGRSFIKQLAAGLAGGFALLAAVVFLLRRHTGSKTRKAAEGHKNDGEGVAAAGRQK